MYDNTTRPPAAALAVPRLTYTCNPASASAGKVDAISPYEEVTA